MSARLAAAACLLAWAGRPAAALAAAPAVIPGDSVYQFHATVTDAAGQALAWQDLRGQPRVATMFYASCRYICPLAIDSLRSIERQLAPAERERLGFVLLTLDPVRDTPAALAKLMSERRLVAARWLLLQPRPAELRGLAGVLGIRYRSLADGEFNHSTVLVLLDSDGRILARTDRLGADGDREFLAAVRRAAAANGSASGH
jgi:protein SCO1/2